LGAGQKPAPFKGFSALQHFTTIERRVGMRKYLLLIPILILALASISWADLSGGSISTPIGSGIYGTNDDKGKGYADALFTWAVTPVDSLYKYTYTFIDPDPQKKFESLYYSGV